MRKEFEAMFNDEGIPVFVPFAFKLCYIYRLFYLFFSLFLFFYYIQTILIKSYKKYPQGKFKKKIAGIIPTRTKGFSYFRKKT